MGNKKYGGNIMANDYHELVNEISEKDREIVRAINSLKEEVDAVDCYHQRVAVCEDEQLKEIMLHNEKEEMEHAIMLLEWLRRNQEGWDEQMRTYLFTSKNITEVESQSEEHSGSSKDDLGIGQL